MKNQTKKTDEPTLTKTGHKRLRQGVVVSDKMQKTIVVKVDRRIMHEEYKKYVTHSTKYKAHDEKRVAKVGDRVEIVESKPISREKRWALCRVLERAAL